MASTDAKPFAQKNVAYRVTFPILDADGDLVTGATALDSEISKDGGTFADCTNEATEIATSSGMYYLDLTSTEMNADTVAIIVKTSSSGAKTTPIVFYPEEAGDIRVNATQWNSLTTDALPLVPTVAGRTLDVSTGGEAGLDWANIGSPTTAVNLSGTNIDVDQVVASVSGAVGSVTGAVGSVTGAVGSVAGNVDGSVATVTTVNGLAAGVITAASIAADAITDAKVAADVTIASVTGAVGSVTGNVGGNVTGSVGSVVGAVGSVTGNVGGNVTGSIGSVATGGITAGSIAADAIGASELAADAVAEIQSGLATSASIAALNNLSAAQVNAEVDTALADIHLDHLLAVDYDPATKPGTATALLNELVESDAGVSRFTANTLELGPTGLDAAGTRAALGLASANLDTQLSTIDTEIGVIDGIVDDILLDTAEIGAAGAGLTNINLPNQTMDIVGNITGNLSGSVGSVAANGVSASSLAADAAQEIADAILVRNVSNVETTAGEHTLATVILATLEHNISGTTWTIKRTDGSTTHYTKTLTTAAGADSITGVT